MNQSRIMSWAESTAQMVIGAALVWTVLYGLVFPAMGLPVPVEIAGPATAISMVMGYARTYAIRRVFEYWRGR